MKKGDVGSSGRQRETLTKVREWLISEGGLKRKHNRMCCIDYTCIKRSCQCDFKVKMFTGCMYMHVCIIQRTHTHTFIRLVKFMSVGLMDVYSYS